MGQPDGHKSNLTRAARWLAAALVLAGLAWYIWGARDELLGKLREAHTEYLAPLAAVALAQPLLNGLIGRTLAGQFGVRLGVFEAYALAVANALGNYLPVPQAGAMARGLYLKRVHGLPYGTFAASLVVTYVAAAALYGVVGLLALAVLAATGRPAPWQLWLVFGAFATTLVLFTPVVRLVRLPGRLDDFRAAVATLGRHHVLARVVALQFALILLASVGFWLACRAFPGGERTTGLTGLLIALSVIVSGVSNLTPGNLGVEQAAAAFTASLLHLDPLIGGLASGLYRATAIAVVFAIGPFLSAWLARRPALPGVLPTPGRGFEVIHPGTIQP
jgi:hypothetical protein